jgi:hypothetical protein
VVLLPRFLCSVLYFACGCFSNRLEWYSDATKRVQLGRLPLAKLSKARVCCSVIVRGFDVCHLPFHHGIVQVEIGEVSLAESALDDEGQEVFRRRGLSLVHTPVTTRQLFGFGDSSSSKGEAAAQSTPLKSRLFSFRDRSVGSSKATSDAGPKAEVMLNCIAPSSGEAAEWKAALEVVLRAHVHDCFFCSAVLVQNCCSRRIL